MAVVVGSGWAGSSVSSNRSSSRPAWSWAGVPAATTRPWSSTTSSSTTCSASSTLWVTRSTPVPASARPRARPARAGAAARRRRRWSARRGPPAASGATAAMAKAVSRRTPPETPPPRERPAGRATGRCRAPRPGGRPPARASRADRPRRRPVISMAARGVRPSMGTGVWVWRATTRRAISGWATASTPATVMRPASGRSNPTICETSVVLPAPLWPSSPTTWPDGTRRWTSSLATTSPNRFTHPVHLQHRM